VSSRALLPYAAYSLAFLLFGLRIELGWGLAGIYVLLSIISLSHAAFTLRDSISRAQLRWGFGGFVLGLLLLLPLFLTTFGLLRGVAASVGTVLSVFSFPVLGISLAVAILRHRLFDIDIIIRRTLVYTVLTLALGVVYFGSIVALQALFVQLTGQESALAVVASTLAIAALFGPLRRRVQAFIDRRFFRTRYDARLVLEQFARRVQGEADFDTVANDIRATVQETLEPEQVQIWLRRS
jgi:hypothetical protein